MPEQIIVSAIRPDPYYLQRPGYAVAPCQILAS